jgi:hypothetical protein
MYQGSELFIKLFRAPDLKVEYAWLEIENEVERSSKWLPLDLLV